MTFGLDNRRISMKSIS